MSWRNDVACHSTTSHSLNNFKKLYICLSLTKRVRNCVHILLFNESFENVATLSDYVDVNFRIAKWFNLCFAKLINGMLLYEFN